MAKKNPLDLPEDRLASLTADGSRSYLYPAEVKGVFQRYRQLVQGILMLVFLILPWIEINGQQALLFNIPQRHFTIFGLTFLAHDAPLFFFVLAALTLGLAFVTSVWGRVWCGWACPQTVFIESIFRRIERWIEGNHLAQRQLNQAPLHFTKLWKKTLKWSLFVIAALLITHSFLAYFVGTNELFHMVRQSPSENWTSFLIMSFLSALILFDFGWFREQFCIIACPYGRFQSVLMDHNTINILYDHQRGEPRKGQAAEGQAAGDCVNCFRCVQVCPTGVDIRRGVQLECIACTACIDACDEIMEKVKKPKGLIRYTSEAALSGQHPRLFRPRNWIYLSLILLVVAGLSVATTRRAPLQITLLRAKDIPFRSVQLEDGTSGLINHFTMHFVNQGEVPTNIKWQVAEPWSSRGVTITAQKSELILNPDETQFIHFFVKFPKDLLKNSSTEIIKISLIKTFPDHQETSLIETKLLGPVPGTKW